MLPLFVLDPALLGSPVSPGGPAVRRPARAGHRPAGRRRPGAQRRRAAGRPTWSPGGPSAEQAPSTSARTRPVRATPRRAGRRPRWPARASSSPDRVPVRGGAGHAEQWRRYAVPGVQPVPPGLAGARRERTGPGVPADRRGLAQGGRPGHPPEPDPAWPTEPGTAGPAGLAGVAAREPRGRGLRPAARLPRPERDLAAVHRPALRAPAPAHRAGRPRAAASKGSLALARQLAWRDFYADTLFHRPDAITRPIKPEFAQMPTDEPEPGSVPAERLAAWQQGRTGYPLVDAGMRQLQVESWMHNRVRMVVASFLIKDLHIGWTHGAAWFMTHLYDGDIAQNQLNWQWVAGCGTDPAPYFRIFNPVKQSEKFDPDGTYIRRYVPELADVPDEYVHEPWRAPGGVPPGYPEPIVDHGVERKKALDRYAVVKR